jgi:hypothetical protein
MAAFERNISIEKFKWKQIYEDDPGCLIIFLNLTSKHIMYAIPN